MDKLGVNHHKQPFDSSPDSPNSTQSAISDHTTTNTSEGCQLDANVNDERMIAKQERQLGEEQNQNASQAPSLPEIDSSKNFSETTTDSKITENQAVYCVQTDSVQLNDVNAVNSDLPPNYPNCYNKQTEETTEVLCEETQADCLEVLEESSTKHEELNVDITENNTVTSLPPTDVGSCHKMRKEMVIDGETKCQANNVSTFSTIVEIRVQTSPIKLANDIESSHESESDDRVTTSHESTSTYDCNTAMCITDVKPISSTVDADIQVQTSDLNASYLPSSHNDSANHNNIDVPINKIDPIFEGKTPNPTVDAGIQVALESSQLKQLNADLRQELETAQNTIIWQSIMLKLYQLQ